MILSSVVVGVVIVSGVVGLILIGRHLDPVSQDTHEVDPSAVSSAPASDSSATPSA